MKQRRRLPLMHRAWKYHPNPQDLFSRLGATANQCGAPEGEVQQSFNTVKPREEDVGRLTNYLVVATFI